MNGPGSAVAAQPAPQPSAPAAISAPAGAAAPALSAAPSASGFAQTLQQLSRQTPAAFDAKSAQPAQPAQPVSPAAQRVSHHAKPSGQDAAHASHAHQAADARRSAPTQSKSADAAPLTADKGKPTSGKQTSSADGATVSGGQGQTGNPLPPMIPVLPHTLRADAAMNAVLGGGRGGSASVRGSDVAAHGRADTGPQGPGNARASGGSWQQLLTDVTLLSAKTAGEGPAAAGTSSAAFAALSAIKGVPATVAGGGGLTAMPSMQLVAANTQVAGAVPPGATLAPGQPGFAQALNGQVGWMVGQGQQTAVVQINPPQLGPLQISVQIHGDQTQVLFQTHHALTKSALDAATPQLRELLGQNGQQVSVNVQQQTPGGGQSPYGNGTAGGFAQGGHQGAGYGGAMPFGQTDSDGEVMAAAPKGWVSLNRGLIDAYV